MTPATIATAGLLLALAASATLTTIALRNCPGGCGR